MLYAVRGGDIVSLGHGCEVSPWTPAQLNEMVAFARRHLEAGATGVAAYAGGRLAGVGILGHAPVRGDARELQLALLHVSREVRRRGIAGRLFTELCEVALLRGARRLYISATPSQSALGFYLSRGAGWRTRWTGNSTRSNQRMCIWSWTSDGRPFRPPVRRRRFKQTHSAADTGGASRL